MSRLPRQPVDALTPRGPDQQPFQPVELWDLVSRLRPAHARNAGAQPQQVVMDETPIHVHMDAILHRLAGVERVAFHAVFTPPHTRGRLLGLFLAILELMKAGSIIVEQAEVFGELWLSPAPQVVK